MKTRASAPPRPLPTPPPQELSEAAYALVARMPDAATIIKQARSDMVTRLSSYASDEPELFHQVCAEDKLTRFSMRGLVRASSPLQAAVATESDVQLQPS